jgi:hypothetical protein
MHEKSYLGRLTMATIAVNILWVLVAVVILCMVVYLAFWVLEQMSVPVPEIAKKAVWIIVLLIALIFLISTLTGTNIHSFNWK